MRSYRAYVAHAKGGKKIKKIGTRTTKFHWENLQT